METEWLDASVEVGNWYYEQMLLGECLMHPEHAQALTEGMLPTDFASPSLRAVCEAVQAGPADPVTVAERLRRSGEDVAVIADLLSSSTNLGLALGARQRVLADAFRRSVRSSGTRMVQATEEPTEPADLVALVRSEIDSLRATAVRCGVSG